MGHWGWRPLVVSTFMSVWVAGCNLLSDSAAATQPPSPYPLVTLTVGRASRASPPAPTPLFATAAALASEPAPAAATPTLSPTAAVYIVQPGDTALDIALRAGVDLQALRAANGGQMLSILQIGQELILPPPAGGATLAASLPTVAPVALSVEPPVCLPFGADVALCLGRVVNGQSVAAAHIEIALTAQGPDGAEARQVVAVEQAVLAAGAWAPYRVQLPFAPDAITRIEVEVSSADPAPPPAPVDVRDPQLAYRDGLATVTATLANPGSGAIQLARAVVTLQAADGRLLGYRVTPLNRRLGPGQTLALDATVVALSEPGLLPRVSISVDASAAP